MFIIGTHAKPLDNAGAIYVKCIKIFGSLKPKKAILGSIIKIVVKKTHILKKIKVKTLYKGVVVNIKVNTFRKDGTFIKFMKNRLVLLSEKNKLLGKRIKGIIPKEVKNNAAGIRFKKLFKYAEYIL